MEDLISACRKHVVARQGPPHLRLETISGRSGPCPVPRNLPPESSVPGETLNGEGGGINSAGGYGSPSVLNEVSHEFSTAMRFESTNGPRKNSFRPDSPHDNLQPGTENSASPSPHRTWSVPVAAELLRQIPERMKSAPRGLKMVKTFLINRQTAIPANLSGRPECKGIRPVRFSIRARHRHNGGTGGRYGNGTAAGRRGAVDGQRGNPVGHCHRRHSHHILKRGNQHFIPRNQRERIY